MSSILRVILDIWWFNLNAPEKRRRAEMRRAPEVIEFSWTRLKTR